MQTYLPWDSENSKMSSFKGSTFVCEARTMHNVLIEDCMQRCPYRGVPL